MRLDVPPRSVQPRDIPAADMREVDHRLVDDTQRPRLLLCERKIREPDRDPDVAVLKGLDEHGIDMYRVADGRIEGWPRPRRIWAK